MNGWIRMAAFVLAVLFSSLAVAAENDALREAQDRAQIEKDHARFNAYWMTVFAAGGPNIPARVAAAGREFDELVRLNGQWLISVRDVAPKN